MKRFAVDIDGVLGQYHERFALLVKALRTDLNVDLSKSDSFGLGKETFCEFHNKMIELGHFETLDLTTDASYLIDIVNPKIDEIWYITSRKAYGDGEDVDHLTKMIQKHTVLWLHSNKLPCSENLIFTDDKGMECARLGLSVLIEDMLEIADEMLRREDIEDDDKVRVYLINKPWNKGHYSPYADYDYPSRVRSIEVALKLARII